MTILFLLSIVNSQNGFMRLSAFSQANIYSNFKGAIPRETVIGQRNAAPPLFLIITATGCCDLVAALQILDYIRSFLCHAPLQQ